MTIRAMSSGGKFPLAPPSPTLHLYLHPFLPLQKPFLLSKSPSILALRTNRRRWRSRIVECYSRVHRNRVESEVIPKFEEEEDFLVVSFYKFVFIKNPQQVVSNHLSFLQGRSVHGRIYINEQGINAQLEGGTSHLPLLDPSMRATPLAPSEWRKRLEVERKVDIQSVKEDRNFLLLDVRNGYEWDIGHFQGAERPNVDCFRGTSFGLSDQEVLRSLC